MKYILLITVIIGFTLLNSCEDSLGIEKNVLITKIGNNDSTHKDTVQKIEASIDSVLLFENFIYDGYPYYFYFDKEITFHEAYVDTTKSPVFIWVRMDVKNNSGDDIYTYLGRDKYTQSIRFIADSLQGEGPFTLSGAPSSGYWSELGVRNIETRTNTFLNGGDSNFQIEFRFDFKKHITAIIYAKFPNSKDPGNPTYVSGRFIIRYPK